MALITLFSLYGKSCLVFLNVLRATCSCVISSPQKRGTEIVYIPRPPVLNTVQWHWVGWMLVLEVAHHFKRWRFSRWILDDIQQLRNTLEELHSINTDNSKCLQASSHRSAHSVAGLLNAWYTRKCRVRFSVFSANAQFSVHKRTSTVLASVVWRR